MMQAAISSGVFLIDICFTLYITLIMLRFLLQYIKADFYNPICQFLMKATNPLLIPCRRIIPGFFGFDCAALVLIYILQLIEIVLKILLVYGSFALTPWMFLVGIVEIVILLITIFIYAIIIQAISSWFSQPYAYNPMTTILTQITDPILRPFRRFFQTQSGMDFSPLVAIIILYAIKIFIMGLMPVNL